MNRMKAVLQKKGMTQTSLAERSGKSCNMADGYVRNRTQPGLKMLFQIAEIRNVDVKDLIDSKAKKG